MSKLKNNIYYINIFLLVLKIFYSVSNIVHISDFFSKLITIFVLATFSLTLFSKIRKNKYSRQRKIVYLVLSIIFFVTSYVVKDYNLILGYFVVILADDYEIKKILQIILKTNLVLLIIHVVAYSINLFVDFNIDYKIYYNDLNNIRHNFFLGHPNYFSNILFSTYAIYIYLKYDKVKIYQLLIGVGLSILTFIFPESRTTAISFFIFVLMIYTNKKFELKTYKIIAKYSFIFFTFLSLLYLLTFKYSGSFIQDILLKLDDFLSGRLWYSYRAYQTYGLTLFGQFIDYNSIYLYNKNLILDSFYMKLLLNYGIFITFIVNYIIIVYNKYLSKKDYPIIIIFSVIAVFENHIMNPCIGIALLIIASYIKDNKTFVSFSKKISAEEQKLIQVKILENFAIFCKKNNLTYFLGGGTLLGAVRHQGYIPWDDDIDVMMPRKDYEVLIQKYNEVNGVNYKLLNYNNCKDYYYPFAKIVDTNTKLFEQNYKKIDELGVYIDIFPIDYISNNDTHMKLLFKKYKKYDKIITFYRTNNAIQKSKSLLKKIIKIITFIFYKNRYVCKFYLRKIDKLGLNYETKNVACISGRYLEKEIMPKSYMTRKVEVEFEGKKFFAPIGYNDYLIKHYGNNYMKLPPKEKQVACHNNISYWKNNK